MNRQTSGSEDEKREQLLALQRVLLENISKLESQIEGLSGKLEQLQRDRYVQAKAIQSHSARLDRLRIDRQVVGFPSWWWSRLRRSSGAGLELERTPKAPQNLLVIAPKYPSEAVPYGGQPVERRLALYQKAGYRPSVLVPTRVGLETQERYGITVHRTPLDALERIVETTGRSQILVHHPAPNSWDAVRPFVGALPVHLWIHGYEARDWREAEFGTSPEEMEEKAPRLDAISVDRKRALGEAFVDDRVTKIFVSEYMRRVATDFVGVEPSNHRIIHNVIDTGMFSYKERREGDRLRILTIRSFATRTYATDLVRGVIEELSHRNLFNHLHFEIRGDGRYFQEDTGPLNLFGNVKVMRGIVEGPDVARLMKRDGVMLIPTRLDTQGITLGEGMSTGMAVVTNDEAAIPEFVDHHSGLLSPAEDVVAMADSIERLFHDPDLFLRISAEAARRVRRQCGPEATVEHEIMLLREADDDEVALPNVELLEQETPVVD